VGFGAKMVRSLAFEVKGKAIPVQAQRDKGGRGTQISRHSAHAGGNLVSPTHTGRLYPPVNITGTHC